MTERTMETSNLWRDRLNRANRRAYENARLCNAERAKAQRLQFRLDDAQTYLGQLCDAWDTIPLDARARIAGVAQQFTEVFQVVYGKITDEDLAARESDEPMNELSEKAERLFQYAREAQYTPAIVAELRDFVASLEIDNAECQTLERESAQQEVLRMKR